MHQILAPQRFHSAYMEGLRNFKDTGQGNAIGKTLELAAIRKDGKEIPIELSVASVILHNEWHAVGILRDISERKQTEINLQAAIELLMGQKEELQVKEEELTSQYEELQSKEEELTAQNEELNLMNTELIESQKQLKLTQFFVDNSTIPAVWVGEDAEIYYVNNKTCEYLGYSREELLKMRIYDFDPNYPREHYHQHMIMLKEKGSSTLETTHICKDGSVKIARLTNFYAKNDSGACNFAYIIDITEQKKLEETLQEAIEHLTDQNKQLRKKELEILENQTKFQAISDTALDAIIMINSKGKVTYWSKAAERILGYTKQEIVTKNMHLLLAPEKYKSAYMEGIKNFKNTGQGNAIGKTLELEALKKDGTIIPIELSVSSIKLHDEWHAVGILRDITERKKLEKELAYERENLEDIVKIRTQELNKSLKMLEEASSHKDKFLSGMSHELRTPLNAIIGFTDMLKVQYFGALNDKQLEYINLIGNSGQHLLSLINDLLDISKIDAGSMEFYNEKLSFKDLMLEITSMMDQQIKKKQLNFNCYIQPDIGFIVTDKLRFKQIMFNLLSNALKFTPEDGFIEIKTEITEKNKLKIYVKDSGIGISEENHERIFSEFYQLDPNRDQALGGTGIGLALTKRLVELQGGQIGLKSKPGEGSTFWFILPYRT